jgi:hypothetical protein
VERAELCIDRDDDRITFRLQPGDRVQLVFHRGTRKRDDATTFSFQDGTGLMEWVAPRPGAGHLPFSRDAAVS